ncbi:hypothetical protein [Rhodococcus ruber]|nr:hypothetical protein [Rhodococcus ruber]
MIAPDHFDVFDIDTNEPVICEQDLNDAALQDYSCTSDATVASDEEGDD